MNTMNEVRTSEHIVKQLRWNSVVPADGPTETEDAPARYPVSLESATSCSNSESLDIHKGQGLDSRRSRGERTSYASDSPVKTHPHAVRSGNQKRHYEAGPIKRVA
jgi:hypothetical protein